MYYIVRYTTIDILIGTQYDNTIEIFSYNSQTKNITLAFEIDKKFLGLEKF